MCCLILPLPLLQQVGHFQLTHVVRMNNLMTVKVNENTSINHEIRSPTAFVAEKMYLGNYPSEVTGIKTTIIEKKPYFKGIIQDVQISNGHDKKQIVEFFKGDFDTNSVERPPTIGKVTLIDVREGEVSDNTCKENPCKNGGST